MKAEATTSAQAAKPKRGTVNPQPLHAAQIAEVGDAEPLLRRVIADDALPISVNRPVTKYEGKAHDVGSAITELVWERR